MVGIAEHWPESDSFQNVLCRFDPKTAAIHAGRPTCGPRSKAVFMHLNRVRHTPSFG
jgi:hypothetical protein